MGALVKGDKLLRATSDRKLWRAMIIMKECSAQKKGNIKMQLSFYSYSLYII